MLHAFESTDVVQQECKRVTNRQPNSTHARQIASHFAQGRQYLEAANGAGELVRPLLVYYSCLSLARAVVMFRTHAMEGHLSQSHGLSANGWSDTLGPGPSAFLDLALATTGGTFAELAAATQNAERISFFTGPGDVEDVTVLGALAVPPGHKLTVGDVWRRIPQLAPLLASTHGPTSDCWPACVVRSGEQVQIELVEAGGNVPDEAQARRMMGMPPTVSASFTEGAAVRWSMMHPRHGSHAPFRKSLNILLRGVTEPEFRHLLRHFKADGGALFVVEPVTPDLNLSTLSLLFAAVFAAGMLVRYHPTTWQGLVRGDKGDRALPVLRDSIHQAEWNFSTLALEAMLRT